MTYPSGVSEESFLAAVNHVGSILSAKNQYGYHDRDDIKQMVSLYAMEALPKYNLAKGNLEGFLFRHCSNRLSNSRRDELGCRSDAPCAVCYQYALGRGVGHPDGSICPKFESWWARRLTRARLVSPVSVDRVADDGERQMRVELDAEADAAHRELLDLIDERLPVELRADYLRMQANDETFTDSHRRRVIREEVAAILVEAGVELDGVLAELEPFVQKGLHRREKRQFEANKRKKPGGDDGLDEVGSGPDDDADEQEGDADAA